MSWQRLIAIATLVVGVLAVSMLIALGWEDRRQLNDLRKRIATLNELSITLATDVAKLQSLGDSVKKQMDEIHPRIQSLDDSVKKWDEIYAWQTVSALENISIIGIQDKKIKSSPFSIKYAIDPMGLQKYNVPEGWKPAPDAIESTLPSPWNPVYVQKFHQPFNSDSFMFNMAMLANLYKKTHDYSSIEPYVQYLVTRLREYSILDADASLVVYKFAYSYHDREIKPGWVSAYGNASVIAGLIYLADVAQRSDLAELAASYVKGLQTFEGVHTPWIAILDEAQYLWFEEMPLDGAKKARILNGHIWALFSLYYYTEKHGDPDAVNMLNAGLTALKRYFSAYRYPGRINRYDLYADYTPDYLPQRTIDQMRLLFAMTGDPMFKKAADSFMTDMRYGR